MMPLFFIVLLLFAVAALWGLRNRALWLDTKTDLCNRCKENARLRSELYDIKRDATMPCYTDCYALKTPTTCFPETWTVYRKSSIEGNDTDFVVRIFEDRDEAYNRLRAEELAEIINNM